MSKIFITGINGFIGSHIAERLCNEQHEVHGLARKTSDLSLIEHLNLKLHYGDISKKNSLQEILTGIDIVIHVAGFASDWGSREMFNRINVLGTKNMAVEADIQKVKRFVHISTVGVHGFANKKYITEDAVQPKTIFAYNETKKEAENWLFNFVPSTEMEITAIRPGNVFGPKDHTFIDKYLEAIENGKIAYVAGGKCWTCPVYIENLVDGILLACFKSEAVGEAFIITDGLEIDWKTFTDKLAIELKAKKTWLSIPFTPAYFIAFLFEKTYEMFDIESPPLLTRYRISNGGRDYHFSIEKAKRLLNYKPKVDFDKAVTRTVDWYNKEFKT